MTEEEAWRVYQDRSRPLPEREAAARVLDTGDDADPGWFLRRLHKQVERQCAADELAAAQAASGRPDASRKRATLTVTVEFDGDYYGVGELLTVCEDWITGAFEDRDDVRGVTVTGRAEVTGPSIRYAGGNA